MKMTAMFIMHMSGMAMPGINTRMAAVSVIMLVTVTSHQFALLPLMVSMVEMVVVVMMMGMR